MKSMKSDEEFGKKLAKLFFFCMEMLSSTCWAREALIMSSSSCFGRPMSSIIFSIWFSVEVPEKMALPSIISPKMQPTLHISTDLE